MDLLRLGELVAGHVFAGCQDLGFLLGYGGVDGDDRGAQGDHELCKLVRGDCLHPFGVVADFENEGVHGFVSFSEQRSIYSMCFTCCQHFIFKYQKSI